MSNSPNLDVSTFMDARKMSARQWLVLFLGFMVLVFDGFDTTAMGFIAPALVDDWGLLRQDLGPVMMSGLLGLAFGSLTAGPLADRFGRRPVIIGSVLLFGVWSLASAWSTGLVSLTILRFLTGVGLGASMPNTATLISEFAPKRYRSHMVSFVYCGFAFGAALGGLGSDWLIEHFGWRSVLAVGGVLPIAFAFLLLLSLPESIRFLAQHTALKDRLIKEINKVAPGLASAHTRFFSSEESIKNTGKVSALFASGYSLGTCMIWLTLFMGLLTMYLLSSWLPLLSRDSGLSLSEAALLGSLLQVGGMLGNFTVGMKMDRWNHHKVVGLTMLCGGICAVLIALQQPTMQVLCPLILLLGYFLNGVNVGGYALAASFYPTQIRATGVCWATGIGRMGAISGAGIGALMLAAEWNFSQVFLFLAVPSLIGVMALWVKGRQRRASAIRTQTT
ncbi:aromatic acid/H+ symport family MFS transporter [Pseudomonas sp.]|uniref:MFS transporter n=1 Tax=Pseudomonas sp. TaxID=306 RepID=UPI002626C889|nr:aromatic acid/H+ symport family MFS transporter [Pseudomonas sp.]